MSQLAKMYPVEEFQNSFPEILSYLHNGEKITVCYGVKKEPVAVLSPLPEVPKKRKLGILKGKASFEILPGFKMTDEELLGI